MSDTPTTAEEVITQAIVATVEARRRGRSHLTAEFEAGAIVAALRSSPEALADLNGGEWVQVAERGRLDVQGDPSWYYGDGDCHLNRSTVRDYEPLFIFVPREDR